MKTSRHLFLFILAFIALPFLADMQLSAQDTIPRLIISEFRGDSPTKTYVEIANVGDTALNLSNFHIGTLVQWVMPYLWVGTAYQTYLPDYDLQPGETYLVSKINDYADKYWVPGENGIASTRFTYTEFLDWTDFPVYQNESGEPEDTVSVYFNLMTNADGRNGHYLKYFYPNGDSVICDAVKNDFGANGRITWGPSAVAGVDRATADHIMVRKANIAIGNTDWDASRGVDADDSEWIVLPRWNDWRNPYSRCYTITKHHGVAEINASTFASSSIAVDIENEEITVPWGIYRDSIMFEFELGKGLAWNYGQNPYSEDSIYASVRTDDTLTMWAVGNTLQEIKFHVTSAAPSADMNFVMPIKTRSADDESVFVPVYYVTEGEPVMDSIGDVPFGLRVDSLYKYLEKPSNAQWEIDWVDGIARADLKQGDILKVTAENGDVKEYFIAVPSEPIPSENPRLNSIMWPDVPLYTRLSPTWGDTILIPGFDPFIYTYTLTVPYGEMSIPSLKASPCDLNSTIEVDRATNLNGSMAERTTTFTVTAEDGSVAQYSILFEKGILPTDLQPFYAEPIVTQWAWRLLWDYSYMEITNPGNQPLDLSQYMITYSKREDVINNPADVITYNADNYNWRFTRYVPGYEYVSWEDWAAKPGHLVIDNAVDPILDPGETFTFGYSRGGNLNDARWASACNVIFDQGSIDLTLVPGCNAKIIPHAEELVEGEEPVPMENYMLYRRGGTHADPIHIFKILNSDILDGNKSVNDPADFQLVEICGDYTSENYNIDGVDRDLYQRQGMYRKPDAWKADTIPNYGFANTPDSSSWVYVDYQILEALGYEEPDIAVGYGLGSHVLDPITIYKSTVSSLDYLVSDGYVTPQSIEGVITSTSVQDFLDKIIKADEGQALTVISGVDGSVLASDAIVSDADSLVVLSCDSVNTTKYALTVSDTGLDDDAVLVAISGSDYVVEYSGDKGTISGIPFGTSIQEVLDNVIVPDLAVLNVVDSENDIVSLVTVNFDTVEVATQASHLVYFEVIAQDNKTVITYQLLTDLGASDALVMSDMYAVDQSTKIVSLIPTGTRMNAFTTHLQPSIGASFIVVDKGGVQRIVGDVAFDDLVIVTSEDGSSVNTYYLQFMEEQTGQDAFVVSSVLSIDQLELSIQDVEQNTEIADFIALLTPAPGASIVVVDSEGAEVSSGVVLDSYEVKVTSGDQSKVVSYSISVLTSTGLNRDLEGISIYPNPSSGELFIIGLRSNCLVTVYDITGKALKSFASEEISGGVISIEDQPSGIYFVTVKMENYHLKTMKVIKQ